MSDQPAIPGRGGMVRGSTWIPSGTRASFPAGDGPVEILNTGTSDLHIGTGPDAVVLAPGESHLTDGSATEIFNPSGERVWVEFRAVPPTGAQPDATLSTTIGVVPAGQGVDD